MSIVTVFFVGGATSVQPAETWSIKQGSLFLNGRRIPLSRVEEVRPGMHAPAEGGAS